MTFRLHLLLILTLSLLQARVSASRLPYGILLDERLDDCPCIVQWGGSVRDPNALQVEITSVGGPSQPANSSLQSLFNYENDNQVAFCQETHVEAEGSRRMIVSHGIGHLGVTNVEHKPCVSTNIMDNSWYKCDSDCNSECGSHVAMPKMTTAPSPKPESFQVPVAQRIVFGDIITDKELAKYNVHITHSQDNAAKLIECTGSLIAPRWVLTVAHCTVAINDTIIVGRYQNEKGDIIPGQKISVKNFTAHEDFVRANHSAKGVFEISAYLHDIQVIELKTPVDHADEHILYVNTDCARPTPCRSARVTGYGLSCVNETTSTRHSKEHVLRSAEVRILDNKRCHRLLEKLNLDCGSMDLDESPHICSIHGTCGSATCAGDSGGPLVVQDGDDRKVVQIGITSYHFEKCGARNHPDLYTRVSAYAKWIHDKTGGEAYMDPIFEERKKRDCPKMVPEHNRACETKRNLSGKYNANDSELEHCNLTTDDIDELDGSPHCCVKQSCKKVCNKHNRLPNSIECKVT